MTFSSFLTDENRPLILDTSVLINLHACSYGERIVMAIPNSIVVPQIVAEELEHETSRKNGEHSFLHGLIDREEVVCLEMTEQEFDLYAELICGSSSLGDGEASTIALAAKRNLCAVIDEKKGRSRAAAVLGGQMPGWSLDLLRHPTVLQELDAIATEALYLALLNGRMRIPAESCEYVVSLIGMERALNCPCLPDYKNMVRAHVLDNKKQRLPG